VSELHRKILVIYNPTAGRGKGLRYAEGLQKELEKLGISVAEMFCSGSLDTMREFHKSIAGNKNNYSLVAIIGGDGTIGPNVDSMIKNKTNVPIYPLGRGTANDFSAFLKTNVSVKNAARIIADSKVIEADTIKIDMPNNENNIHYAVSDAAGGAFTPGVMNYTGKRVLGRFAYIFHAGWHTLWMKAQKMKFTVDGDSFEQDVFLFYILNTKNVGSIKGAGVLANINDGLLDLVCIKKCGIWGRFCIGLSALFGRIHKSKRVLYRQGKKFKVEVVGDAIHNFTKTDTDGNIGGDYPLNVEIGPKIRVVFNKNAKIN
jgi:diacylglycerol kinase (ATP)